MKLFILILFCFCISNNVSGQVVSTFIKRVANGTCGISTGAPIVQQLSRTLSYTGSLFWSDSGEKVAYIDRYGPALGRYTPSDGRFNRMQINEGKAAIAIFPVKNATGLKFVVGLDNKLILADVVGSGNNFTLNLYDLITVSNSTESFQRGKCDNKGRLWYSSAKIGLDPDGHLYKIENLEKPIVILKNLYCGAGMAWTKDYAYFYLVDSCIGVIYKYNFNADNGTISNPRIIFKISNHPKLVGKPYDIAIDTDGYIWISMIRGGMVIHYDEKKEEVLWEIAIPAWDVVSVEFGGLDKKTLYVGTEKPLVKKKYEQIGAGAMFGVSGLGVTGIADNEIIIPEVYRNL